MTLVYAAILLGNAFLLFWVEPLVAKILLPYYGGSAGVWNTCVAFYQVLLVAGYAYAHFGRRHPGWQCIGHAILLGGAVCLSLALLRTDITPPGESPNISLVGTLIGLIGVSFFVVASHGPLLQSWIRYRVVNPYVLFAASNFGSLLGLLAFPLLLEPHFASGEQILMWNVGLIGVAVAVSTVMVATKPWLNERRKQTQKLGEPNARGRIEKGQWLTWVALSAVPSALMLAVTSFVSNEIAAAPLLWVFPLVLYLLTFVLAFSDSALAQRVAGRLFFNEQMLGKKALVVAAMAMILGASLWVVMARHSALALIGFHFVLFFMVSWNLHSQLARSRPAVEHLTEYYLWLGVGGAIGGMVVAFVAPILFTRVHEYPMTLAAAMMLWNGKGWRQCNRKDFLIPLALGALAFTIGWTVRRFGWSTPFDLRLILIVAGLGLCVEGIRRVRLGLGIMILLWIASYYPSPRGWWLAASERNFYGAHRVYDDPADKIFWLQHGDTIHGAQFKQSSLPLTYYSPMGPAGDAFRILREQVGAGDIGIVGLGAGSLLYYGVPADRWTLFELDPDVVEIAQDPAYFRYLSSAPFPYVTVLGDGRVSLAKQPDQKFDLLVIDAFGSDSVPMHLLTREAMAIYASKLKPTGLLLFHCSNRFFDLSPVISTVAHDLGFAVYRREHVPKPIIPALLPSRWLLVDQSSNLRPGNKWRTVSTYEARFLWTDQFSSILPILFGSLFEK